MSEPSPNQPSPNQPSPNQPSLSEVPLREVVALCLRAGRRLLRLDQRSFAARAGLSKSTLARLETAAADAPISTFQAALAAAGHRLAVTDENGRVWRPDRGAIDVDGLGLRDEAARRFPAHLDLDQLTWEPEWRFFRRRMRGGPLRAPHLWISRRQPTGQEQDRAS
jgi:transcriptional regulator with XRE-family HTH domain